MKRGLTRGLLIAVLLALVGLVVLGSRAMYFSGRHEDNLSFGGPFTLTDQDGRTLHEADFRGKLMLVYFGYTFCPDLCPTELALITTALQKLGPAAKEVQPIFVTIDPARDTPSVLKQYLANFYPTFVGLTGTPAEVAAIAREYRVYYAKEGDPKATSGYLVDHTGFVYLQGRSGQPLGTFPPSISADHLVLSLKKALAAG